MQHTKAEDDRRWSAIFTRDPRTDGEFVFGVKTTGIYCRPSCPARHARRQNVVFFPSCEAAEDAGFRACLRCRPKDMPGRLAAMIADACRALESDTPPNLDALAKAAGLSRFHFHRVFKAATGVTPKAYAKARRGARLHETLGQNARVTEAIYDAGYNSSSRFYTDAKAMLGMTPTAFRDRGKNAEITYAAGPCSLGYVLVARSAKGICTLILGDDVETLEREIKKRFANAVSVKNDAAFAHLLAKVVAFVDAPGKDVDLPLDIRGTLFQQKVWQALREIPPGETASYAEIARRIGKPSAARAVARACADNKIAVAIPCHRVLRGDGGLSGYRWGTGRKRALLDKERLKKG